MFKEPLFCQTFYFNDGVSPLMEELMYFHDYIMEIVVVITFFVMYYIFVIFWNKMSVSNSLMSELMEVIWTIIPIILVVMIAVPSMWMMYYFDDYMKNSMSVKVMGNQWYWSYEYSWGTNFESYKSSGVEMKSGYERMEDVDNRLVLPILEELKFYVSSEDVIHSWSIPSLGIKIDATPGRVSLESALIQIPGLYFGYCSEICGVNHSQMPIVIESIPSSLFWVWVKNSMNK